MRLLAPPGVKHVTSRRRHHARPWSPMKAEAAAQRGPIARFDALPNDWIRRAVAGRVIQPLRVVPVSDLAQAVDLSALQPELAGDIESSVATAIEAGVVLPGGPDVVGVFQDVLRRAIREIESHPRGRLLKALLGRGPRLSDAADDAGLSDDDTHLAINFVRHHMVTCFQGGLAELLALKPCLDVVSRLRALDRVPADTQLWSGESIRASGHGGAGRARAADAYLVRPLEDTSARRTVQLVGVIEVKSNIPSRRRLEKQLEGHVHRSTGGLLAAATGVADHDLIVVHGPTLPVTLISVVPSRWRLGRGFAFNDDDGDGSWLRLDPVTVPTLRDDIAEATSGAWRVTLRWSQEALAAQAHEMTFWYMEKIGELLFSKTLPVGWERMSPAEAGRNAAKESLYYAMRRARTRLEYARAVGLYNTYGFGYALGMSFRDAAGRRDALFPRDLREIQQMGRTRHGARLR